MADTPRDAPHAEVRLPLWERLLYAIPILGWMLKDVAYGDPDNVYHFVFTIFCLWAIAVLQFGLVGLVLPALGFVPLIAVLLFALSRG